MTISLRFCISLTLLLWTTITLSLHVQAVEEEVQNANHIFNAIHSSMRQWGSSWNHNGMSFFLATVPANTEFYHGRHDSEPIKGMEWLAFEPEHSLSFATHGPPPEGPRNGRRPPPGQHGPPPPTRRSSNKFFESLHEAQAPLHPSEDDHQPPGPCLPPGISEPGYLHTYRTKRDLSLLYIDGLSAGKSSIGTLDSQDYLLLNWTSSQQPSSPFDETKRATELCSLAKNRWQSKIDGFIRTELGFELVLCDFEANLDPISVLQTKNTTDTSPAAFFAESSFNWYRGIAARFDGVGYDRVTLNYDSFITAYAYYIDLFADSPNSMPRLQNISRTDLARIREDIDELILTTPLHLPDHSNTSRGINWQAVTDNIINRYGTALPYLASLSNTTDLHRAIETLMYPFIDFATRDLHREIDRCTTHFLPPSTPAFASASHSRSPASRAVTAISRRVCSTLLSTLYLPSDSESNIAATSAIAELIEYLDWTMWRKCARVCAYDEVCFIPIWPLGTVADREMGRGRCLNATGLRDRDGPSYWNGGGEGFSPP